MRILAILLVCPLLSGCFAIGYPEMHCTPEVAISADHVQAFRIANEYEHTRMLLYGNYVHSTVQEVPIVAGKVEPQQDAQFSYIWSLFPLAAVQTTHDFEVLLYRPGYEFVDIPSSPWWWPLGYCQTRSVDWRKIEMLDLPSQIKNLEMVIQKAGGESLNQEMCSFAAREYRRLAQSSLAAGPEMHRGRERLLVKARYYEDFFREQNLKAERQSMDALDPHESRGEHGEPVSPPEKH